MKILLSAYACEPGLGSEPGTGWNWALQVARFHEVWVATRSNNREPIEQAPGSGNIHWVYYDLPTWARFWKKGKRLHRLYYVLWQMGLYFRLRKLHRDIQFDLVHHLTLTAYWAPSLLAFLPCAFIAGPLGGGESSPASFNATFGIRGRISELLRSMSHWLAGRNPILRRSLRRAQLVLATTSETAERVRKLGAPRVVAWHPPVGVTADQLAAIAGAEPLVSRTSSIRFLSAGRLVHWKGHHLAIQAFARVVAEVSDAELWIIGDGPERSRLERIAVRTDIASQVRFTGEVDHDDYLEILAASDVLVHPGLHDPGAWVVIEAMASAKPVVCLDSGGPALLVTGETGIRVPATTPGEAVAGLSEALIKLAHDHHLMERLGKAGRRRVGEHFVWDRQGEVLDRIYCRVG